MNERYRATDSGLIPLSEAELAQLEADRVEYELHRSFIEAQSIRSERNRLLSDCDWTQLPDAPTDAEGWANYRQALRDITTQEGFPTAVTWPIPPNAVAERARNELGQFVADDPATPDVNEAWVEGAQP